MFPNYAPARDIPLDKPITIHAIHERAAFYIDMRAAAYIILKYDQERGRVPEDIQGILTNDQFDAFAAMGELPGDYHDIQMAFIILNLWGIKAVRVQNACVHAMTEFHKLAGRQTIDEITQNETIVYIPHGRIPQLFRATYTGPDELMAEYMAKFHDAFPPNYNAWRNICYVMGNHIVFEN